MTSLRLSRYLERILNERAKGLEMLQPKLETFLLDTINPICLISIYTMDTLMLILHFGYPRLVPTNQSLIG